MADPVEVAAPAVEPAADAVAGFPDPLLHRAQARLGSTLRDKWRLDQLLGLGGTAAVYASTHRNGSRAAVKILHAELSIHPLVRQRFLREGYAANAVGHDGAVKVIDDDEAHDGSLFLVTELLEGESLEERRLRCGGRLSEREVLLVTNQLLDVLAAAHDHGIIHRDLKPDNVFLTRSGQVKVLDFGIARLRELSTTTKEGTQIGAAMGTPAYMAPEQALGLWDDVDALSDLWAWGATMFHLLSGSVVHEGRTVNEQLLSAMTKPARPLASVAPGMNAAVEALVDRALEFEKDKRWPDARSMQQAVRKAYSDKFGAPIEAAQGLAAPDAEEEWSPAPTRAGATPPEEADPTTPRLPTTAPPVEREPSMTARAVTLSRSWRAAMVLGGAALLGVAATSVHSMEEQPIGGTHKPSGLAQPSESVLNPPVVVLAPSPSLPGSAVADPRPTPNNTVVAADGTDGGNDPADGAAHGMARPVGRQDCNPPYSIDPDTGKHRWKLECL